MAASTIGFIVLLVMCLVATHCQARKFVLQSGSSVTSITKSTGVCKVSVFCQVSPTNSASSIKLGSTTICPSSGSRETTVDVGTATTIPVTVSLKRGDYYRAIITEQLNSCSDETVDPGNKIKPEKTIECDVAVTDVAGSVMSPGQGQPYVKNLKCVYTFAAKTGYCGLKLNFATFELQDSPDCEADSLTIGSKAFCDDQLKGTEAEYKLPFNMTFTSNDDDDSGDGFIAVSRYLKTCTDCNKKESKKKGFIRPTLGDEGTYEDNMLCTVELQKSGDSRCVKFTFAILNDMSASGDYLEIGGVKYNGSTTPADPVIVQFPLDGRPIDVIFKSDGEGAVVNPYLIKYEQLESEADADCGLRLCQPEFSKDIGELKSPEDPNSTSNPKAYPKNFKCKYTISKPKSGPVTTAKIYLRGDLANTGETLKVTAPATATALKFESEKDIEVTYDAANTITIEFTSDGNVEEPFTMFVSQS